MLDRVQERHHCQDQTHQVLRPPVLPDGVARQLMQPPVSVAVSLGQFKLFAEGRRERRVSCEALPPFETPSLASQTPCPAKSGVARFR